MLRDGSRQKKGPLRSILVPYGYTGERFFCTFLGGPQRYFLKKRYICPPWDVMCTYHPDASRTHRTHEGHPPKTTGSYLQKYPQYCYSEVCRYCGSAAHAHGPARHASSMSMGSSSSSSSPSSSSPSSSSSSSSLSSGAWPPNSSMQLRVGTGVKTKLECAN